MSQVKENISKVKQRIKIAAEKVDRDPGEITLLAVTKTATLDQIKETLDCGITDLGENKVQFAVPKIESLSSYPNVKWHMIGHLQTNKAKKAVDIFNMIHAVDSLKLAAVIDRSAAEKNIIYPILIEVNISGEESKYGISPEALKKLYLEVKALKNLIVKGLMTMAPYSDEPRDSRPIFKKTAGLAAEMGLKYLSMGMTGDFEVAIEEGASIVRVGSAIFG